MPKCLSVGLQHVLELGAGDVAAQHALFRRHLLHQRRVKYGLVDEEWRPHHLLRRPDLTALARWSSYPCHGLRPKCPFGDIAFRRMYDTLDLRRQRLEGVSHLVDIAMSVIDSANSGDRMSRSEERRVGKECSSRV